MCNRRLMDGVTLLKANFSALQTTQVSSISKNFRYQNLLTKFPWVVRESITPKQISHGIEHVIETKGPPLYAKVRRLSSDKLKAIKEEFDFMIWQGLCRPSKNPWATPLHLVRKKNNDWKSCGDYRKLNEVTVPDQYPIPFLDDCTDFLHGKSIFFNDQFGQDVSANIYQRVWYPKNCNYNPFRAIRVYVHDVRVEKRRCYISAFHEWGYIRPWFLFRLYRRHSRRVC